MRKIASLRTAAAVAVLTLLTTCLIGGTFAKYTTKATSMDGARTAHWGFEQNNLLDLSGLFLDEYDAVTSLNGDDVIAPGTEGFAEFSFRYDNTGADAPEVDYTFTVTVTDECAADIKNNTSIRFKLDDGEWGTWDTMVSAIKALSGDAAGTKVYQAGELPAAFNADCEAHKISWKWDFTGADGQDAIDTAMGNAATLATCSLTLNIEAVQLNE